MPVRVLRGPLAGVVEHFDATHRSEHSTRLLARHLDVRPGDVVAEIGCGTGALALLAARRGAREVWATDVDPAAIALVRAAAAAQGLAAVHAAEGAFLDPLPAHVRPDLVVTVMPQKPAPARFSLRYAGGPDGADLLVGAIAAAAARLAPGGRLLLFHHTIAAPARVEAALSRAFRWETIEDRARCMSRDRYDRLAPGMAAHLDDLAARGVVLVERRGAHLVWRARAIAAVRT